MSIVLPIVISLVICVIVGAGLSAADVFISSSPDEKYETIRSNLPGANCGACGFAGCDQYASALSKGETTNCSLCKPGGQEVANSIASYLGLSTTDVEKTHAIVKCSGFCDKTEDKMEYAGAKSCLAVKQLFGGKGKCTYGCIGFGDCANICEYGAISICNGVAIVSKDLCKACGRCVKTCPNKLIELIPFTSETTVYCSNTDKGSDTRKSCSTGCIGCMKCEKNCPNNAIKVENYIAKIDYSLCTNCGNCKEICPQKVIH